jgi:hypothetical protein
VDIKVSIIWLSPTSIFIYIMKILLLIIDFKRQPTRAFGRACLSQGGTSL